MRQPHLLAMGLAAVLLASLGMLWPGDGRNEDRGLPHVADIGIAAAVPDELPEPVLYRVSLPGLQSDKPSPDPPPLKPPSPISAAGLRIWAYGDSTSWFATQEFVRLMGLEGATNVRGVAGTGADEVSRRGVGLTAGSVDIPAYVAAEMAAKDPDVVVLMFGANDAVGGFDQDTFRVSVGALMDQLQRTGRIVLWIGEPAMTRPDLVPQIEAMNALFEEEAAKREWVRFVDAYAVTLGRPLAADGVHPSAASGTLIAAEAIRVLFGN